MELSLLALQATNIALWAVDQTSGGLLQKAGSDIFDYLKQQFQNRLDLHDTDPQLLQAAIVSEAEQDQNFQRQLSDLVNKYSSIQQINSVSQSNKNGVNMNVENNSGTVIGQQNKFFR